MHQTKFFKPNQTKLIPNRIGVFFQNTETKQNWNKITIPHITRSEVQQLPVTRIQVTSPEHTAWRRDGR